MIGVYEEVVRRKMVLPEGQDLSITPFPVAEIAAVDWICLKSEYKELRKYAPKVPEET